MHDTCKGRLASADIAPHDRDAFSVINREDGFIQSDGVNRGEVKNRGEATVLKGSSSKP